MEDHQGELILEDRESGGARAKLIFAGEGRAAARPVEPDTAAELSSVAHGA